MRRARVFLHGVPAGVLTEQDNEAGYTFRYDPLYSGPPVSLTLPVISSEYTFKRFPPFFEGLLPEGFQLDHILQRKKIDRDDYFGLLLLLGHDLVGAVTLERLPEDAHE